VLESHPPAAMTHTPDVAWPTLAVLAGVYALWGLGAWIGSWTGFAIVALAAFWAFTPMHDAAHGSVSRRAWINGAVGHAAAFVLNGPFACFKHLHLTHHRFTNEPGADPDFWAGTGASWQLPLRWLTQELHYYAWYFARWSSRPRAERLSLILSLGTQAIAAVLVFTPGVLFYWIVPAKLASALLAFSFDYLPHRPHSVPAREDRYRASHVIDEPLLTPLFLFQNYHLIHHLHPGVPFYGYTALWRRQKEFLLSRGTRVMRFPRLSTG